MCSLSVFLQEKLFPQPSILHWYFMLLSVRAVSTLVVALALLPASALAVVLCEFSSVNIYIKDYALLLAMFIILRFPPL